VLGTLGVQERSIGCVSALGGCFEARAQGMDGVACMGSHVYRGLCSIKH